jgi:hypothetical protein
MSVIVSPQPFATAHAFPLSCAVHTMVVWQAPPLSFPHCGEDLS